MEHAKPQDVAWGETRTREVTWTDPVPPLASLRAMPGLDFLQGMIDGHIPPSAPCSTPSSDAPCTPRSTPGGATPPSI